MVYEFLRAADGVFAPMCPIELILLSHQSELLADIQIVLPPRPCQVPSHCLGFICAGFGPNGFNFCKKRIVYPVRRVKLYLICRAGKNF